MGSETVTSTQRIRFGSGFEIDPHISKLYRDGRRLRLERIPFDILLLLIEHQGRVVTRDQIVERIWGANTFFDTDNSINGAIRKIRQVLRDNPENPAFIQTITGKGYRFIGSIAIETPPAEAAPAPAATPEVVVPDASRGWVSMPRRWLPVAAALTLLASAGLLYVRSSRTADARPAEPGRPMIAVLPFENLTGDRAQDYFSDGLTEEMITQLGNVDPRRLGVIARTSVMHYAGTSTPLSQIVRELGVQYVLEGSFRRDGRMLRITAQLIQAKDETHLWAREYDRELEDVLTVQGEIAEEIADGIGLILRAPQRQPRTIRSPALSQAQYEAYDLYLKGLYYFNKRDVAALRQAIPQFEQAIARDPEDARAYAGLSGSLMLLSAYSLTQPADVAERARRAALRALEIDGRLPEAHTALALVVENYDWDWQTADREFRRAIELNPNYATAHHWYAENLMWRGRFDEALQEIDRARQLDPLSLIIAADRGAILYYARRYDQAIREFRSVLDLEPNFPRAQLIASAYVEEGRLADALAVVEKQRAAESPVWYWSNLAYLYGRAGRTSDARHALDELTGLSRREEMDPAVFMWSYAAMGDRDDTFKWLQRALAQHSNAITGLKVGPGYDRVRSDPRFQDVLRRVGLAD